MATQTNKNIDSVVDSLDIAGGGILTMTSAGNIVVNPNSGTGTISLEGKLKTAVNAGTPTNPPPSSPPNNPVSYLKITVGTVDYYLPLYQ